VDRPLGFLTADRGREVAALDPAGTGRLIARADRVLEGFAFPFGHELAISPSEPSVDPLTEYRWPSSHGKKIDYRAAPANPKWIWELNRCQELPILVAAALVSGESRYATRAASGLLSWISTHPPGRGIAWANGFEAGLRAISFALTLDGLDSPSGLTAEQRNLVVGSLWQHARWIERDPSTHSSANNHRIGELVGLLYVAHLAPELHEAPRWASDALAELCQQATWQVRPDGTGAEQSFAYTLLVLDLLLLATALLDARSMRTPHELLDALERASYALWAQVGPGEPEPDYGDNDDGHAARLDGEDSRRARQVAGALCARLGNRFARAVAESLDVRSIWMFGTEGKERFERTLSAEPAGSVFLPDGGIVILRSGDTRATLDAGPLGYLRLAAHGHADALALTVAAGGRDLIVDPGTGTYAPWDAQVRNAFRGTGFHATVVVDGEDQSVSGGPFLWNRHARSCVTEVDLAGGLVVAEHDGYLRLPDPVRHRRAVLLLGSHAIVVVDRLASAKTHATSIRWPLHRTLGVELEPGGTAYALDGDELLLTLSVAASTTGTLTVARGGREPFAGWSSPRLEEVVASPLLSWDTTFDGELTVATLLQLGPRGRAYTGLELRPSGDTVEIELPQGLGESSVRIDFGSTAADLARKADC
jgi:uncharacterized heparinase superfamily protein